MNAAQQIHRLLGVAIGETIQNTQRNKSATKSGTGRRHVQGDGAHEHLTFKQRRAGMFGKGIRNTITVKNLREIQARKAER